MAWTKEDEAVLTAAVDAWDGNRRAQLRTLVRQLAVRERDLLPQVWRQLAEEDTTRRAGLVQVAVDAVSADSTDILQDLWEQVDPARLTDLMSITRDLLPWDYCWASAIRSLYRDPKSGREHVGALGNLVRMLGSRKKRKEAVDGLLSELREPLIGPSVIRMLMGAPSGFVSTWVLKHIRLVLDDDARPDDLDWNGVPATIASVLLAGGIDWKALMRLLRSELDRERRVGAYVLAGHLSLQSDYLHDWMTKRYRRVKDAPSRGECQAVLIESRLLVACEIRGLG